MHTERLTQLFSFLEIDPKDSFTLYSIAYEYLQNDEWDLAIEYFERLKNLHPDYVGTYYHLGKTLERIGKQEKAIAIYREGMVQAQKKKAFQPLSELQGALNSALGLDFEDDD